MAKNEMLVLWTLLQNLILGGVLALLVRGLYQRCNRSIAARDSFSSLFPLLTITTIIVIFVVKSSLALSLGLVGALSIVRFRAAIKDPEELVYLFLCIAVGLALGADLKIHALVGTLIFTVFVCLTNYLSGNKRVRSLLVTISGNNEDLFKDTPAKLHDFLKEHLGQYQLQRLETEEKKTQIRIVIGSREDGEILSVVGRIREELPKCTVSYVNLSADI